MLNTKTRNLPLGYSVMAILLTSLLISCASDEVVTPPPIPLPINAQVTINQGNDFTAISLVTAIFQGEEADSVLTWTGSADDQSTATWNLLANGSYSTEFNLFSDEGPRFIHAVFSGDGGALSEIFSDTIIVDSTPPNILPSPIYPLNGATGIPSILAFSWTPASDAWCPDLELNYVVIINPETADEQAYGPRSELAMVAPEFNLGTDCTWLLQVSDLAGNSTHTETFNFTTWNISLPSFITAPAGTFTMGSPENEVGRHELEVQHEVTLTQPFAINSHQLTTAQYMPILQWALDQGLIMVADECVWDIVGSNPVLLFELDQYCSVLFDANQFSTERDPESVYRDDLYWHLAPAFCDWLNSSAGLPALFSRDETWDCNNGEVYEADGFRLATEAEWEYACRAGSVTGIFNGEITNPQGCDTFLDYIGWYSCNMDVWGLEGSKPAMKLPNAWGLYDMNGAYPDPCYDWFGYYSQSPVINPINTPSFDFGETKMFRPYAMQPASAERMRSASRFSVELTRDCYFGFRVVRSFGGARQWPAFQ